MKNPWLIALASVLGGAVYGLLHYFIFRFDDELMTVSFIFLVPLAMGVVAALLSPISKPARSYGHAALAILFVTVGTTIWQYESMFCWVILAPIAFVFASLGVFIVNLFRKRFSQQSNLLFGLVLLPVVAMQLEQSLPDATTYQTTHTSVVIHASPERVWDAIKSVPEIQPHEYKTSWTHAMGLPRPLAATLSHEGVGGVRRAGFSNGLEFLEEVSDWQVNKTLAFSITAQGQADARRAFYLGPEIGGKFVDVQSGRYTLEGLDNGQTLLHLYSTQRLSSKLNLYAGFWVHAVMRDLQSTILEVIKNRCENVVL